MNFPIAIFYHSLKWQHKYLGTDFSEKYFFDCDYRINAVMNYHKKIFEIFGDIGLGQEKPQPEPVIDCCGGILGKAVFGIPVVFHKDSPPDTMALNITDTQMRTFELAGDFQERFPFRDFRLQAEQMKNTYGEILPTYDIYHHGVVNLGLEIRGNELMLDGFTRPEELKVFFNSLGDGILKLAEAAHKIFGKPPFYKLGHCSMSMFSPDFYRQFVLDVDAKLAQCLKPFGMHHHGRTDNGHLDAYKELESKSGVPIEFFDLDWNADISYFRGLFPQTHLFYIMEYNFLANANYMEFCQKIEEIQEKNKNNKTITFIASDLDDGISESSIRDLANAINTVTGRNDFA